MGLQKKKKRVKHNLVTKQQQTASGGVTFPAPCARISVCDFVGGTVYVVIFIKLLIVYFSKHNIMLKIIIIQCDNLEKYITRHFICS